MEILKTKEKPWEAFRSLLKEICKKFPARDSKPKVILANGPWDENKEVSVSVRGFLLLEAVEEAMQSTEQEFKSLHVDSLGDELLYAKWVCYFSEVRPFENDQIGRKRF